MTVAPRGYPAAGHGPRWGRQAGKRETGRGNMRQRPAAVDSRQGCHQPETDGPAAAPIFRTSTSGGAGLPALHRQDKARRFGQAAAKDTGDAVAFLGVFQPGSLRGDILGRLPSLRIHSAGSSKAATTFSQADPRFSAMVCSRSLACAAVAPLARFGSDQGRVQPDRLAIPAPVKAEGPAWQRFARIPLLPWP